MAPLLGSLVMKSSRIANLLKKAYSITLEETDSEYAQLNISWLDVHGNMNKQQVKIRKGQTIEF